MKKLLVILFLYQFIQLGCITNSGFEETLDGIVVNKIEVLDGKVFFCTDEGVFIKTEIGFNHFGLKGTATIDITKSGMKSYLAARQATDFGDGQATLFQRIVSSWRPFMGNFGGEDKLFTFVGEMGSLEEYPETIYLTSGSNIVKTIDGGLHWQEVHLSWSHLGSAYFLEFQGANPDTIWFGGANVLSLPVLKRTLDGGSTWEYLKVLELEDKNGGLLFIDNVSYDIIFNPDHANQVMVALSGFIRKTEDFGENWTSSYEGPYAFYTFARSVVDPQVLYASGKNKEGSLFLFKTEDFGDTWEELAVDSTIKEVYVIDMVSVIEDGQEILYFGTNKGVFTHQIMN